ncbi:MAG: hypothetical protein C0518_12065 [Opitutus sp.]|nr:hypothetical protein [Opitutus sp.]
MSRPLSSFRSSSRGVAAPGDRGAVLVVALLIMAVLALGLTSYLSMNVNSARQAQRGFQQAAAFNLAEAGAEEALWSFNQANAGAADAWSNWTLLEPAARRTWSGFDFGSATGNVKVYVDHRAPSGSTRPTIVALATVSAPGGAEVSKMLEVSLRRRSRFSAGLMAKDAIVFSGTRASVDSWNSDPDNNPATAPVPYSSAVRNDRGSVASVSVGTRAVLVNQADVYGYVYTGGPQPEVGRNGRITGRDTPVGVNIDPSRVTTDFSATFPDVGAPADGISLASLGTTLGTEGEATRWRCANIALSGRQTLTILGDVTLILTAGSGARAIDVTGNASIIIPANSSLTVYVEGDVLIAGNGIANDNVRPISCQIYGTNTTASGQTIHLAGNGALQSVVYAPNADLKINGNGDIMGAAVARSIDLTGNADFHYDESLEHLDTDMPYGIDRWRELTTETARASQRGNFSGW